MHESLRLDLLRWPVRLARQSDGKTTYPGVGISIGVSRLVHRLVQPGTADREPQYADRCTGRAEQRRTTGPRRCGRRSGCAARGIPVEVAPAAAKFGKQIKFADRRGIPFVWFSTENGPEVKDIRSGEQVPADPPPGPRPRKTYDQVSNTHRGELVIRTHSAGSLRAENAGQTVTLAGWVARRRDHGGVAFIDLRDSTGTVQVVIRDEEAAHGLRSEYCLKVVGEVSPRPEGNANPNLPTGEIEIIADRGRGAERGRAAAVPGRGAPRDAGERGGPAQVPVPRPAPPGPGLGAAPAQQGEQGRPRGAVEARLRRDRDADADQVDAGRRPRLPGPGPPAAGQLVRAAAVAAAVQAAADGGRDGAVLPDRPLLPRRGLPRRPAAGVHPARRRDELRRPGRHHRAVRGDPDRALEARRVRRSRRRSRG